MVILAYILVPADLVCSGRLSAGSGVGTSPVRTGAIGRRGERMVGVAGRRLLLLSGLIAKRTQKRDCRKRITMTTMIVGEMGSPEFPGAVGSIVCRGGTFSMIGSKSVGVRPARSTCATTRSTLCNGSPAGGTVCF